MQAVLEQFKDQILAAAAAKTTLNIMGGNTKHWYGDPPVGEVLATGAYAGILDYQPEELVITVCAGTPLKEVEAALAEKNQYFPFEPPHFGENATMGGMVAAGITGPGRGQYGGLRDYVLGTKIMSGHGQILSFGGKVMKNVAGYDVSRLIPGSLGTLALLLEVSIKVLPRLTRTQTLRFRMPAAQAITQMNTWASLPLPLSASAWIGDAQGGDLWLRLAGAHAAVESALKDLQKNLSAHLIDAADAQLFWESLREHTHPFFTASTEPLWRFSVAPLAAPFAQEHPTVIEWLGGQRWIKAPLSQAKELAYQNGGSATLFRHSEASTESVFTPLTFNPLTAPLEKVQQSVRKVFDPHGVFQTGRMPY